MQIILLEKVVNLGQLGDVVRVRDGYARNFLIPKGKARRATQAAVAEFEARRAELERIQAEKLAAAQAEGNKLAGRQISLTEKAGVDGRLFGSVTNANIADALHKAGFAGVQKQMVRMPQGHIKTIGEHPVQVALHTDVLVDITVNVVGETA
ncbi:MAG: 50S ribosomal protein L9 [Lautropia sp.]|nr:50S ribosomal protein L9 [Lautropia sp.]